MRPNCVKKIFYTRLVLRFQKELRVLVGTIWESMSYYSLFWSHFGAVFHSTIALWSKLKKKFFFWSKSGRPYDSCPKAKNLHGLIAWNTFCGPILKREITVFTQFFWFRSCSSCVGWGDLFLAWNLRKPDGGQFSKKKLRFAVFWHVWHLNAKFMKYFAI